MSRYPDLKDIVERNTDKVKELGRFLWEHAEVGNREFRCSAELVRRYRMEGFEVARGVGFFPTSFIARWRWRGEKPRIGLLSDFDALPHLSLLREGEPGQGCMHHQYAARAFGTAVVIKQYMERHDVPGEIVVFGAPAEEIGGSKQYFARQGLMDGVDAFIGLHPVGFVNGVMLKRHLASSSRQYHFYGRTAHAALAPERGINALTSLEFFNLGVQMLRAQVPDGRRINHVIKLGGEVSNMIPDHAIVDYSLRAEELESLTGLTEQVDRVAKAAAEAFGCRLEIHDLGTIANSVPNMTLARIAQENAEAIGAPIYTKEEQRHAIERGYPKGYLQGITPLPDSPTLIMGSTDEGDVSWIAPWVRLNFVSEPQGLTAHTQDEVYFGGLDCSYRGSMETVCLAVATILDLLTKPGLLEEAKEEHRRHFSGKPPRSTGATLPDPGAFPRIDGVRVEGNTITLDPKRWPLFPDLTDTPIRALCEGRELGRTWMVGRGQVTLKLASQAEQAGKFCCLQFMEDKEWRTLAYALMAPQG